MTKTMFLDLDAVKPEVDVSIKINGTTHNLVPPSVEDFLENTKMIQAAATQTDLQAQFDMTIKMLIRAFPTLPEKDLRGLTLPQLNRLIEFAQEHSGEKKVSGEMEAAAAENPPVAGT